MLHIHAKCNVGNSFDLLLGHRRIQRRGDTGLALPCKEETKTKQAQKGKKESLYLLCFPRLQLTITPNLTTTPPPFFLKRKQKLDPRL